MNIVVRRILETIDSTVRALLKVAEIAGSPPIMMRAPPIAQIREMYFNGATERALKELERLRNQLCDSHDEIHEELPVSLIDICENALITAGRYTTIKGSEQIKIARAAIDEYRIRQRPKREPDAYLFDVWSAGRHSQMASTESDESQLWPFDSTTKRWTRRRLYLDPRDVPEETIMKKE